MLRGDARNSRGYFLLLESPHPVFLVKSRGIVMFSEMCGVFVNDVTKTISVLMINIFFLSFFWTGLHVPTACS